MDIGAPECTDERVPGQEGMGARTPLRRSGVGAQRGTPEGAPHSATVRVAPVVLNSRSVRRLHAWRVILCVKCHQDYSSATSWCVLQCNPCIVDDIPRYWVNHADMDDVVCTESCGTIHVTVDRILVGHQCRTVAGNKPIHAIRIGQTGTLTVSRLSLIHI